MPLRRVFRIIHFRKSIRRSIKSSQESSETKITVEEFLSKTTIVFPDSEMTLKDYAEELSKEWNIRTASDIRNFLYDAKTRLIRLSDEFRRSGATLGMYRSSGLPDLIVGLATIHEIRGRILETARDIAGKTLAIGKVLSEMDNLGEIEMEILNLTVSIIDLLTKPPYKDYIPRDTLEALNDLKIRIHPALRRPSSRLYMGVVK